LASEANVTFRRRRRMLQGVCLFVCLLVGNDFESFDEMGV
jgi:hypothetical protein